MDWLLAAPQLHSAFASLGSLEGDTYVVSPDALSILEEINYKLTYEDQTLRTFRRAICFGQNVRSDLIPLLENAKDDAVLESVIRILVNLTVPVECLFSVDVMYRTDVGRHTIFELNKLLYTSKEAFTEAKSTKSVVEYMKHILESDVKLSPQKCDQINNCLLLLRNILHIPETHGICVMPMMQSNNPHGITMQNTILWNLFIQSIDKLLIYLMTCPQRAFWGVTMVQLIALIYKDQHVSTLQKLLNLWFEASLSESSEDNESNTTPPKQGSGESSPMLTSDPTGSDSSDNGSQGRSMSISMSLSMSISMSSLCGKKETPEERQQALRDGTEATLQEVSRKGQEYQDAIEAKERMGSAMDDVDDYEESDFITRQLQRARQAEQEEDDDEECDNEVAAVAVASEPLNLMTQPADNVNDTTTTTTSLSSSSIMPFRAPLPVGSRPSYSHAPPQHQSYAAYVAAIKVCHAGKLQLTKGKCCPQKRECPSSQSELSDCGYATQVENQESVSTSSNDDDMPQGKPLHQKPPCNTKPRNKPRPVLSPLDKKELRRKKLVKRSKSNLINMKGLVQHTPTEDDISNLLKEFTVDFLLKGYNYLVEELHAQLLANTLPIDTSHFFWLVTYFLKFAAQLELDMEHIDTILTYDVLSYLTYEGVMQCEQLEQSARQQDSDLKPHLRRMHLLVTAIREFLQAIETYNKVTHLSDDDRDHLRQLKIQIADTSDLHCLFVLLLRRFNPTIHSKQYLQDLIVTNHILLLVLDERPMLDGKRTENLTQHIAQFATLEVMHYYGILLEDFTNNGEFVNDCIFTMMHHVCGDLGQIGVLFQPIILKTYSRIWETEYVLCDDWSDLIEYVIHKFMNTPPKTPMTIPTTSLTEMTKEHNLEHTICSWNPDEMDTLYWYYVQSKSTNDTVGKIVRLFNNNGNKVKSRISIIQQLLQQDIITLLEYDDLMRYEDAEYQRSLLTTPSSVTTESGIEMKDGGGFGRPSDDIQILLDLIIKDKKSQHLEWVQKVLLECCYIKLNLKSGRQMPYIMEPVAYHYIIKQKSIPVVQWNNEQSATLLYQPFVLLLHKLGIQLPVDAGSIFARIPDYWSPEKMYGLAKKLGAVNKHDLKFDATEMEEAYAASAAASAASMQHRSHHNTGPRNSLSSQSSLEVDLADGELSLIPEVDAAVEKAHAMDSSSSSTNEFFAMPRVKTASSMMRYTPDPTPPVPNWLQLVMRSKRNPRTGPHGEINDCGAASATNLTGDDESMGSRTQLCPTMYQTGQMMAMTPMPPMNIPMNPMNPRTTMPRLHSIMGPHNDNSNSSGCGGTVYSQSMGVLMTTSAVGGAIMRGDVEEDAAIKSSFEKLEVTGTHFARASYLEEEYSAMVAAVFKNENLNDNVSVASDLTRMYVSDEDVPRYH